MADEVKMIKCRLKHGKFSKRDQDRQRVVYRAGDDIMLTPAQAEVYRDMIEPILEASAPETAKEVAPPSDNEPPAAKPATKSAVATKPAAKAS